MPSQEVHREGLAHQFKPSRRQVRCMSPLVRRRDRLHGPGTCTGRSSAMGSTKRRPWPNSGSTSPASLMPGTISSLGRCDARLASDTATCMTSSVDRASGAAFANAALFTMLFPCAYCLLAISAMAAVAVDAAATVSAKIRSTPRLQYQFRVAGELARSVALYFRSPCPI